MANFRMKRALFPVLYYAANAIYQGYISLYYVSLGFSGGQLGFIGAVSALSGMIFQPLWGAAADRSRHRRRLLALIALAAAILFPLKLLGSGFPWQLMAAAVFSAFFCALLPLGDALLLQEGGFGAYRLAGGISFALSGALYGLLGGGLWLVPALLGLAAISALKLPQGEAPRRHASPIALLKNRQLLFLLICTLPLQMTMAYFHSYYPPHFQALGGSKALLGLGHLICAAAEAPYLLLSGRIYRRWGAQKPMAIAAGLLALRYLLLGITRSPWIALLSQVLHGGGFIVISVSMALWISDHVPEGLRASGQSLLNMVVFGLARILGNALGGLLVQETGMGAGFLASAALSLAAGAALLCKTRR